MIIFKSTSGDHSRARKLSSKAVKEIRQAREKGETIRSLAIKYGVHKNTIYRAIHAISWRSVK